VFELSSTASTRDEIACSVYVGQTARLRTKKAYSDDWVGIPYPYPDLTVYTRRFVMVAKFGVDSIGRIIVFCNFQAPAAVFSIGSCDFCSAADESFMRSRPNPAA